MYENEQQSLSKDKISDYLSGNLCRCTGYRPILDAAQKAYDYPRVVLQRQKVIDVLKEIRTLPALHLNDQKQQFLHPRLCRILLLYVYSCHKHVLLQVAQMSVCGSQSRAVIWAICFI